MNNKQELKGYVYILEVKDIDLPVCKIGMTTRAPHTRCAEINNSSTGDFIWEVVHYIAVDNCKKLESLIHSKLAPLRQKRREFFNLNADDANKALISIFNNQSAIKEIILPINEETSPSKKTNRKNKFKPGDSKYAVLLQLFTSLLNVKGKPFGQLNKPIFGISDGNEGVQWNLSISTDTGVIKLGVNLEGMQYKNWPISTFIQSELNDPKIEEIKALLNSSKDIYISLYRDAWQVTARPIIIEKLIGNKEHVLSEISLDCWTSILNEALECLNQESNYRGRAKQTITLENIPTKGEQIRTMSVSPHLTIWLPINLGEDLQEKFNILQPIYDWITKSIS